VVFRTCSAGSSRRENWKPKQPNTLKSEDTLLTEAPSVKGVQFSSKANISVYHCNASVFMHSGVAFAHESPLLKSRRRIAFQVLSVRRLSSVSSRGSRIRPLRAMTHSYKHDPIARRDLIRSSIRNLKKAHSPRFR
jgi:hypothetical protein